LISFFFLFFDDVINQSLGPKLSPNGLDWNLTIQWNIIKSAQIQILRWTLHHLVNIYLHHF